MTQAMYNAKPLGPKRVMTHLLLGGMTIALYLLIAITIPRGKQGGFLVIALGYLSLLLIFVTLLIGPLNLLRLRRNPVNIDLRRDIGIWAGITGCLHVLLVFRGTVLNGQILLYFLQKGCCGYTPLLSVYGISNDLGLFATLLLILLLALSNTVSLRVLKGKWWKQLQRLNYLLILLAVGHTFGFQYLNLRGTSPACAGDPTNRHCAGLSGPWDSADIVPAAPRVIIFLPARHFRHVVRYVVTIQQGVQGDAVPLPEHAGCMCPRTLLFPLPCCLRRH